MSVAPAMGMLGQEHREFEASLRDKEQLCVRSLWMKCALEALSGGKHPGRLQLVKREKVCGRTTGGFEISTEVPAVSSQWQRSLTSLGENPTLEKKKGAVK